MQAASDAERVDDVVDIQPIADLIAAGQRDRLACRKETDQVGEQPLFGFTGAIDAKQPQVAKGDVRARRQAAPSEKRGCLRRTVDRRRQQGCLFR